MSLIASASTLLLWPVMAEREKVPIGPSFIFYTYKAFAVGNMSP